MNNLKGKGKRWQLLTNILIVLLVVIILLIQNNIICIYKKRINNEEKYISSINKSRFIHISFDDCIDIFENLSSHNYNSIFENKFLSLLKEMHNLYGAQFSLYCYNKNDNFELKNCTTRYKRQFEDNSEWLKFGFHANDSSSNYNDFSIIDEYNLCIESLKNIVGEKSLTNIVRLDRFILSQDNIKELKNSSYPVIGLLGADTNNRQNYYLTEDENNQLFSNGYLYDYENNIFFYKTDIRIENLQLKNIWKSLEEKIRGGDDNLIVFSHEWKFYGKKDFTISYLKLRKICEYSISNGYNFGYPYCKEGE